MLDIHITKAENDELVVREETDLARKIDTQTTPGSISKIFGKRMD